MRVPAINRPLNFRHRFALVILSHRVTRDVEAIVSCESHSVPWRQPVIVAAFDEAVADANQREKRIAESSARGMRSATH
jgi:hypothetical protein